MQVGRCSPNRWNIGNGGKRLLLLHAVLKCRSFCSRHDLTAFELLSHVLEVALLLEIVEKWKTNISSFRHYVILYLDTKEF